MEHILSTELLLIASLVFLLAGFVKGIIGIGLPTIIIAVMAQFTDPRLAIALLLFSSLTSNGWQIYQGGQVMRSVHLLWPYVVAMMITMYITSLFAADAPVGWLLIGIGGVIVLWAVSSLIKSPPRIPDRLDPVIQPLAGVFAGLLGGLSGIWSPSMVVYLLARGVDKEDFVRFTGFIILTGSVPLALGYITTGLLTREIFLASVLLAVPTFIGLFAGRYLRGRLNGQQFFTFLLVVFGLMGVNLIWRGISAG